MAILKIATIRNDFDTMGGEISTDSDYYDVTRVENAMKLLEGEQATISFTAAAGNVTYVHFCYGSTTADGNFDEKIVSLRDGNNDEVAFIQMDETSLEFAVVGDTTTRASPGTSISIGTFSVIDLEITVDGTTDIQVRGFINSALQFDETVANTGGLTNPVQALFLSPSSGTLVYPTRYVSEVIVADEDTRGLRLRELKPQSFGIFNQWDGTASSVADGSLATGVSTDVADERSAFGLRNLENVDAADIINRVVIQTYAQRGASGLTSINHFFRYEDTTIEDSTDISLGLFGAWYIEEFANNPDTAVAWVPADLEGIQIGVRART